MDWMFVSLQNAYFEISPPVWQYEGGGALGRNQVMRGGCSPQECNGCPYQRDPESSPAPSAPCGRSKNVALYELGCELSSETEPAYAFISDFPASRNWNVCGLSHPVCSSLLQLPGGTKTSTHSNICIITGFHFNLLKDRDANVQLSAMPPVTSHIICFLSWTFSTTIFHATL